MTRTPLSFRGALAGLALVLPAAALAGKGSVGVEELVRRANGLFASEVQKAAHYPELAGVVTRNQRIFNDNTKKFLHNPPYQPWEVDYVHDSLENLFDTMRDQRRIVLEARKNGETSNEIAARVQERAKEGEQNQHQIAVRIQALALQAPPHVEHDDRKEPGEYGDVNDQGESDAKNHKDEWSRSEVVKLEDYALSQAKGDGKPTHPDDGGRDGGTVKPINGGGGSDVSGGTGGSGSNPGGGSPLNDFSGYVNSGLAGQFASAGGAELDRRQYGQAYEDARQALALDPSNREATAVMHLAEGHIPAAGAAASASGAAAGGAAALGASVPGAGRGPAASAALAASAARAGSEAARAEAVNALRLGDSSAALGTLDRALAQDPGNPALLNLRASVYASRRDWARAIADAKAGLALAPNDPSLLRTLAYAQLRSGGYKDALASSSALIAADPKNPWGYALRAHAEGSLGDRDAMMADLRRAAALDPRFAEVAQAAGRLQLPSDSDVLFLFPGEADPRGKAPSSAPAPASRARRFGTVVGVAALGGLLLALGLLQTVLAPIKEKAVSAFTRLTRTGPSVAPIADDAPAAGRLPGLIRGQYEISRQIGAGGMGMVYEGTDRSLGRRVAIKKMRDEIRYDARERARFVTEAKTVAALHHPNIVDIYAIAEDGEDVFLVFEYVDGKTVHDLVQSRGRLEPEQALRIVRAAADALEFAHGKGVIHRDMKPSNVMIGSDGRVKVMDFGIARVAKDAMTRHSMTNTVVGTPPYMAPEQEQGRVRKEADVYALAVCAYEMLTGRLPFAGIGGGMLLNKINMSYVPPSREVAGLPPALDEVFARGFQADPDSRWRTPREFADALASALPAAARA